jgi:hypothetical protein
MPMFRLSDAEASALVDYFLAMAGRSDRAAFDPLDEPLSTVAYAEPRAVEYTKGTDKRTLTVRNEVEEAKALFEAHNCVTCHLKRGTPGADPNDGGSAPPFELARPRLRRDWVVALLHDPLTQIEGTKMTGFWPLKAAGARKPGETRGIQYPAFRFGVPKEGTNDDVAQAQMEALARYLLYHYEPSAPAAAAPPAGGG